MKEFRADLEIFHIEIAGLSTDADIADRVLQGGDFDGAEALTQSITNNFAQHNISADMLRVGKDRLTLEQSRLRRIELSARLSTTVLDAWVGVDNPEEKADELAAARARLDDIGNGLIPVLQVTENLLGIDEDEPVGEVARFMRFDADERQRADIMLLARNHAHTLSALARVACGFQAIGLFDEDGMPKGVMDGKNVTEEQKYFGRDYAHGFGELAEDWGLVMSNAAYALRAVSLKGEVAHALPWVSRYVSARRHLKQDKMPAGAPFEGLTRAVVSQQAAVQSIRQHP